MESYVKTAENRNDMEISFDKPRRSPSDISYTRSKTLPAIPAGSEIFEQVLREMRNDAGKSKNKLTKSNEKTKARGQWYNDSLDSGEEVVPGDKNDMKSPEMYVSCNRYPWICFTTKCARQPWKVSDMRWNSIKAVATANADQEIETSET